MPATLPKWTDAHSIALFLAAIFGAVVTVLGVFHIAVSKGVSADVTTISGIAATLIALAVNTWTHRSSHTQAAVAQAYAPSPEAGVHSLS